MFARRFPRLIVDGLRLHPPASQRDCRGSTTSCGFLLWACSYFLLVHFLETIFRLDTHNRSRDLLVLPLLEEVNQATVAAECELMQVNQLQHQHAFKF